jgi:TonB family protein
MKILGVAIAFFAIVVIVPAAAVAQKTAPTLDGAVLDRDIQVLDFVELAYPFSAKTRPEGVVVLRAGLDQQGGVSDARVMFGDEILATAALSNIRHWRFKMNSEKAVVLVYNFRLVKGKCQTPSSFFTFQRPNLIRISACSPPPTESSRQEPYTPQQIANAIVSDADVEVSKFEEMEYPRLAALSRIEGVVVIQAKLSGQGEVEDASTVSGDTILAKDCLDNVRKWRFRPNSNRTAIVVYSFRFPCGNLSYKSEYQHQFVLQPPNFAEITGTARTIQTQR